MNIYLKEMRSNLKSLIIWSVLIFFFVFGQLQKFEAFAGDNNNLAEFNNVIESMPRILQNIWGTSVFDITTAVGYFGVLFPFLILIASIHAGMFGSNIVSKEERDKTIEFLMSKPIDRSKVITSKILVSITHIIIINIVMFSSIFILLTNKSNENILNEVLLGSVSVLFIQLLFMFIGVGVASIIRNYKKSGGITIAILLGTYFISLMIDLSEKLDVLKIFTPFKYFDSKQFIIEGKLNIWYVILTLILCFVISCISYLKYSKRDLNI